MDKKLFFSIILIIIVFITSCNEKYNIGGKIIPANNLANVEITDTVKVIMYTDSIKHLRTDGALNLLVGKYSDPTFGTTEASFITQVQSLTQPDWGDSAIFDSVCISFALADDYYYGTKEAAPDLSVYEIKDSLKVQKYYSDADPSKYTDYNLLGTGVCRKFVSSDSIDLNIAGYRLRLDDAFGKKLIDNASFYFNINTPFYDKFGGFYVKSNNSSGIYKFRTDVTSKSKNFGLIIYYHFPSDSKSLSFVLPVTLKSNRFNMFTHNYTGTPFVSEMNATSSPAQYVYLQGMAGTKIRVTFPGLRNFNKKVIINKAVLVLKNAPTNVLGIYSPIDKIWFLGNNLINYNTVYFNDFLSNSSYSGFEIAEGEYKINITRIVQNYINSYYKDKNVGLYLDLTNSINNFKRTIITNGINSGNPSKLVITYTNIN